MSITPSWITKANFYHIYPLGFCGCERTIAEFDGKPVNRIKKIIEWIPHLKSMNINAVYLGPIFDSVAHGYDTTDYKKIDPRLGTNADFSEVCKALHDNGIKVVLDGVFNHVGRNHFAFKDVCEHRHNSQYCGWFCNLNFGGNSKYNDGFWYEGWNNCYDLVKLNLHNIGVVEYLLDAIKYWIDEWHIDGIRFDAADCLDSEFIKRAHSLTKGMRPDFWLMGEIIHGDYRRWANPEMFDCVTNYQWYKGMYSSHNDRNYFEIAHNIEYQLGQYGQIYMYNFLDNHDVVRLASVMSEYDRIYCCYTMMYTLFGMPSIYYGSEFGIRGAKGHGHDADVALRPCLELDSIPNRDDKLLAHITKLGAARLSSKALQEGTYKKIELKNQTLSYMRECGDDKAYIALNISDGDYTFIFNTNYSSLTDAISGKKYAVNGGNVSITLGKNESAILVNSDTLGDIIKEEPVKVSTPTMPEKTEPIIEQPKVEAPKMEQPVQKGTVSLGVPEGREIVIGGRYKHFKGGEYLVLNVARDTESFEQMVVYIQLYNDHRIWVRSLKMFLEDVDDHGNRKARFEYMGKFES